MSVVGDGLRSAVAAVTFLTAIPLGRSTDVAGRDLRGGLVLFPVIGAVIGALMAATAWAAALVMPPLPAAVLGVAAGTIVTAAIHLDGLADTADGVGAALAGRDPAEVMHDPRLGTFGGAALAFDVLLKVSVLSGLAAGPRFPVEAIAAGALARAAAIALIATFPYAGSSSGAGDWTRSVTVGRCLVGVAVACAIAILAAGWAFAAMAGACLIVTVVVGRWSRHRLGGVTGDTLGAAAELTETLALTVALAVR